MKKILCIITVLFFCVVVSAAIFDKRKGQVLASTTISFASTDIDMKNQLLESGKSQTQENYSFKVHPNAEQLKLINSLKGKKMTRLEFFQKVFPDIVEKLSDKQKKLYASTPFEVPDPSKTFNTD